MWSKLVYIASIAVYLSLSFYLSVEVDCSSNLFCWAFVSVLWFRFSKYFVPRQERFRGETVLQDRKEGFDLGWWLVTTLSVPTIKVHTNEEIKDIIQKSQSVSGNSKFSLPPQSTINLKPQTHIYSVFWTILLEQLIGSCFYTNWVAVGVRSLLGGAKRLSFSERDVLRADIRTNYLSRHPKKNTRIRTLTGASTS